MLSLWSFEWIHGGTMLEFKELMTFFQAMTDCGSDIDIDIDWVEIVNVVVGEASPSERVLFCMFAVLYIAHQWWVTASPFLQLLHWNGSLAAMRERQCSRQEVDQVFSFFFYFLLWIGLLLIFFFYRCIHKNQILDIWIGAIYVQVICIWQRQEQGQDLGMSN